MADLKGIGSYGGAEATGPDTIEDGHPSGERSGLWGKLHLKGASDAQGKPGCEGRGRGKETFSHEARENRTLGIGGSLVTLARAFPVMWWGQSLLARRDSQAARSAGVRLANVAVVARGRGQRQRRVAIWEAIYGVFDTWKDGSMEHMDGWKERSRW